MMETSVGLPLDEKAVGVYLKNWVAKFFKVIPIRESNDPSLTVYLQSLQREILGCEAMLPVMRQDAQFLSLVCRLQYLIDTPEMPFLELRRDIFTCISICNKLRAKYGYSGR